MFTLGQIIEHRQAEDLGRAKVEYVSGDTLRVLVHRQQGGGVRTFRLPNDDIVLSANQDQTGFDGPKVTKIKGLRKAVTRPKAWGFDEAHKRFLAKYPGGFQDSGYVKEEREYKQHALDEWQAHFSPAKLQEFRQAGPTAVGQAFAKVYSVIALMHPAGEWIPFKKLLDASPASFELAEAYVSLVQAGAFDEPSFKRVLDALAAIGDGKPKWTVFTYWPYVATKQGFAFLKPTLVKAAAEGMDIGLNYEPMPNWQTYQQTVNLYQALWQRLQPLGAQDWVDVQSFLWIGWKD